MGYGEKNVGRLSLAIRSMGAIQRLERRVGIIAIDRVERIVGIDSVDGIKGVVRVEPIDRIRGIARIDTVDGVEGILGIHSIDRIQWVVRTVLIDWIEDIVITLILLVKAGIGQRGSGEEEETEEPNHPHGEPPKSEEPIDLPYSQTGCRRKRVRNKNASSIDKVELRILR